MYSAIFSYACLWFDRRVRKRVAAFNHIPQSVESCGFLYRNCWQSTAISRLDHGILRGDELCLHRLRRTGGIALLVWRILAKAFGLLRELYSCLCF